MREVRLPHRGLQIAGLAAAYFVTARLGLTLDAVAGFATLVWAPAGIALAALLIWGYRIWPAIAAGAFLANLSTGAPFLVALGIAAGNALEAVIGTYLLRRVPQFELTLRRIRDVLAFLILAAFLSTSLAATTGTASLYFGGIVHASDLGRVWSAWWIGDGMGEVIVAPLLLVWWTRDFPTQVTAARMYEAAALALLLAASAWFVFSPVSELAEPYVFFPVLILAALRFGQRGVVTALFLVSAVVIASTALGYGPFVHASVAASLFAVQSFMAVTAPTFLVLGAAISSIRDSERRKAAMLNASLDCIITIDHEGRIVEFNPAAERTFGYRRTDVLGQEMAEFLIPNRLREPHRKGLKHYLLTKEGPLLGHRIDLPALRADGTEFLAEMSIEAISLEGPPVFTSFVRDITEKRLEETRQAFLTDAVSLFASDLDYERSLAAICRQCVLDICDWCAVDIVGPDGRMVRIVAAHKDPAKEVLVRDLVHVHSPAAGSQYGDGGAWRTEEPQLIERVTDTLLLELAAGNSQLATALRDVGLRSYIRVPIRLNEIVGGITLAMADTPRTFSKNDLAMAQRLAGNTSIAIENFRIHQAQLQARAQAEEAVRARDEFLSIASHELRNPLNVLLMGVGTLKLAALEDARPSPERVSQALDRITRQIGRLTRLVENLLDVSKLTIGRIDLDPEPTDLAALAAEVVSRWNSDQQLGRIEIELEADVPVVGLWDRMRLDQIITNLVSNAVKYGAGKPILVAVQGDSEAVRIVVQDHGIGIAPRDQSRIFGRFERVTGAAPVGGLGLGLFIVHQIVDAFGGEIHVASELGRGSTFTVQLPRRIAETGTNRDVLANSAVDAGEPHAAEILVVEDEADALETVADLLRSQGYTVMEASNGKAALQYLARAKAPKLILLDMKMPVMDGAEFLRAKARMPELLSAVPVVLTSADDQLGRKAVEFAVAGFLPKPLEIEGLLSTVALYCRRGGEPPG